MNERIEELAEQCWTHTKVPLFGAKSPHWEFDRQKFAELIVRECADIADKEYNILGCGYITKTNGMRIREHFGVE